MGPGVYGLNTRVSRTNDICSIRIEIKKPISPSETAFELNQDVEIAIQQCKFVNPHAGWEYRTAFMIDCSDLMDFVYGYCPGRKTLSLPPGKPLPDRTVTQQDHEWT